MASEGTVFSKAGDCVGRHPRVEEQLLAYKSIGTEATVYHREQTKNIWG